MPSKEVNGNQETPQKCHRTVCTNLNPRYWNSSTRQLYCGECARKINAANGVELCTLQQEGE